MTAVLLALSFLESWSVQECGPDMVCGVGARGELGPFQIHPSVWEGRGCEGDPLKWKDSAACAMGYLENLKGRQMCEPSTAWGLAAYNAGIGWLLDFQREYGCDLRMLPDRIYWYVVIGIPEPPNAN
ncbi:MAG: hypothetical protein ABFD92_21090 [Planctomycetaceae bacterium]